jgi:hypothetical protein
MSRVRVVWFAVWVALIAAGGASVAHAGPVEQLRQLALQPGKPDTRVLRYDNGGDGLFYSTDAGKTFALACVSSIDPTLLQSGSIAMTGDGVTLMGVFKGAWQDDGHGCGWTKVPELDGLWITDFAQDPRDDAVTYAISSSSGKENGIFKRDASGTWTEVGKREEVLINTLDVVAAGDELRFYEGLLKTSDAGDAGPVSSYVLRYSDDQGATWTEYPFAADGPGQVRIAAIDPSDPDRVVVSIDRENADDSVLVSTDKAKTFREYLTLSQYGGIAFAPDGRVWIGESGTITGGKSSTGLWAAASLDQAATKLSDYVVQCLTYDAKNDALLACQHWFLGTVDPKSGEFTSTFSLADAGDFLSCTGADMPATCKSQLCMAYCGPGHFAKAPLCAAYDDPMCGPTADESFAGSGGSGATGSGGSGATAGDGAAMPSGSGGASAAAGGSGGAPSGGGSGTTGSAGGGGEKKSDGGGCSVAGGEGAARDALPSLAAIGLALLLGRRRARRPARRHAV